MRIKVATHSGFCFGVKRAINIVDSALKNSRYKENIYSLGPIIHNPQVVNSLLKKGLYVIGDIDAIEKGTLIISSHGAPQKIIRKIRRNKMKLIDATCPFVKYAHDIIKRLKGEGYKIVVVGDKDHPEVKALLSTVGNVDLHRRDLKSKKVAIISQTTQNRDNYIKGILDILKTDFNEARIFNTICNDTTKRQTLTSELLKECDVMVVVGGKNSANTKRLHQICKESKVTSYHIERESELKGRFFSGKKCAGVVSGASTPDSTVKKVVKRIKNLAGQV
ncbi:MAG: 4-hydroxy-3-methylbut-2-enyl diphosphate reductase [Candidatus Omnitrophica bacterium]|nr:4-hydroxy-3-methylbut-2-enyl diphosphate reductase [Candidatus Omnitrophota bacterium]